MPAFSLIFNKLEVVVPAKNFSLSVDSFVSLQCYMENTQPIKTRQLLDLICSRKVWITYGNGCRIDFIFPVDRKQDEEPAMERIIDDLASYVRDVPLWSQVSLLAKLEPFENDTNNNLQSRFSITLTQAPLERILDHSNFSLLSTLPDVQVPAGIPCFQLRRIKIVMTFSSERASQKARPPLPPVVANVAAVGTNDRFPEPTPCLYPSTLSCEGDEMLKDDALLYEMDIAMPLLTSRPLTKPLTTVCNSPHGQVRDIEVTPAEGGMASITSDLKCAKEMTHLALRKLVGCRRNKREIGIKVVLRRPTLTLSNIAPSLFSPGFAEAMAERSRFIPAISHTLSVSLLHNAQSPSLRRKLLSLISNPIQVSGEDVMMDPINSIDERSNNGRHLRSRALGRVVEERLWEMMHCSLNHPQRARRTVPSMDVDMSSGVRRGERSTGRPKSAESMMEESVLHTNYDVSYFDDEFEDLFGDVPDEGHHERLETWFDSTTHEIHIDDDDDDDFEDLFKDEIPAELDDAVYARLKEYDENSNMKTDHRVRCWEYEHNTNAAGPLNGYFTENHGMSDRLCQGYEAVSPYSHDRNNLIQY